MGYKMPVFLYNKYKYDPEDPDKGLFQSMYLVCVSEYMHEYYLQEYWFLCCFKVLIDILYGPQAVDTENAKQSEHHWHHCVGDMYDADAITPQMIAYSAVVVHSNSMLLYFGSTTLWCSLKAQFVLSSRRMWNWKDDAFDYRIFYCAIIIWLSNLLDPWVDKTLKWWNI